MNGDLDSVAVAAALPGRPVRAYPALLSTEADAMAWARAGTPSGSVVVADYQVSPRGRAGLPWLVHLGQGLGFSMVLRPELTPEREGWPYVVASVALGDALAGEAARFGWPDRIDDGAGGHMADLGVHAQLGPDTTEWVVLTVLVQKAEPPRAAMLARLVGSVERRLAEPGATVLDAYRARCGTLGTSVCARLIPLGPGGPQVVGTAVDVLDDGALVLLTKRAHRVAVRPTNLGLLEPADSGEADDQLDDQLGGS